MSKPVIQEAPCEGATTEEILVYARDRISAERLSWQEWIEDLEGQLDYGRAMLHEAMTAERELERLTIGGDLYQKRPEAGAEPYWPDEWPDGQIEVAPESADVADESQPSQPPQPPEPEPIVLADLPPALIEQLSPAFVTKQAAQPKSAPTAKPQKERVDYTAIGERVMASLSEMLAQWPDELDGQKVAKHIGEPAQRVYPVLRTLAEEGKIQYVRRLDHNQIIVLMPGAEMPHSELTPKQQAAFDFLAGRADGVGVVSVSTLEITAGAGLAGQVGYDTINALERKGYLSVIYRGDSRKPATYRIPPSHRVAPASPPTPAPTTETVVGSKLRHAKELIGQGWTVRAAAAKVDADLAALTAALSVPEAELSRLN